MTRKLLTENPFEPAPARPAPPAPAQTDADVATPSPARRRKAGPRWDERHQRHTTYIDVELLAQVERACARLNLSKSQAFNEALTDWVNRHGSSEQRRRR